MTDLLQYAWRELGRRKARAAINMTSHALVCLSFVILIGLLNAAKDASSGVLISTGTHFAAFAPQVGPSCCIELIDPAEGLYVGGTCTNLFFDATAEQARQIPSVRDAAPYLLFRFRDANGTGTFSVGGFDPQNKTAVGTTACAAADIVSGCFLTVQDRGSIILEEAFAKSRNLSPGQKLSIAGVDYSIAGVVNPGVRPAKADVYMLLEDAQAAVNRRIKQPLATGKANLLLVEVRDSRRQNDAMRDIKALLPGSVISSYACHRPAAIVLGMTAGAAWTLQVAIAVLAILLVVRSQLATVIERRREIGILKAIGWTNGDIGSLLMIESLIQAILGGLAGALVAIIVVKAVPLPALSGLGDAVRIALGPWLLIGFALAVAGGAVAGLVPMIHTGSRWPAKLLAQE